MSTSSYDPQKLRRGASRPDATAPQRTPTVLSTPSESPPHLTQTSSPLTVNGPASEGDSQWIPPPPLDLFSPADGISASTAISRRQILVPGYEILGELGAGGMGAVYKARQFSPERVVALKLIKSLDPSQQEKDRFRTEADAIARLEHPGFVAIFEVGEYELNEQARAPYMSMEFCSGGSLAGKLEGVPLVDREAATLVSILARSMQVAHEARIIHRDLKPGNILLKPRNSGSQTATGDQETNACFSTGNDQLETIAPTLVLPTFRLDGMDPKISDFGLARKLDQAGQTVAGRAMGTPEYMPPEQAEGKLEHMGPAVDIYSLGAILYECLTGRPPFRAANAYETLYQVIHNSPVAPRQLNTRVPSDLETICLKCLQKEPEKRYKSAQALAEDLERWLRGEPILARPAGWPEQIFKWVRRSPWVAATLGALLILVLSLVVTVFANIRAALSEAEQNRLKLEQKEAREKTLQDFNQTYLEAEEKSEHLTDADLDSWAEIRTRLEAALKLIEDEGVFPRVLFREKARDLLSRAETKVNGGEERLRARKSLPAFREHHSDAVFFGSLAAGTDPLDCRTRTRKAVLEGLRLFGMHLDNTGPPNAQRRFFSQDEIIEITEKCREMLLIEAWLLMQPLPQEDDNEWKHQLSLARIRLDRADSIQNGSTTKATLFLRQKLAQDLGNLEASKRSLQQMEETAARHASDYFLPAVDNHLLGKRDVALADLARTLQVDPRHYGAEFLMAKCQLGLRKPLEAFNILTQCLEQRPDFPYPRLLRCLASLQMRDRKTAWEDLDIVLNQNADQMTRYAALVSRSVLSIEVGDYKAAFADLEKAISLKPDAATAYLNLAQAYRQRWEKFAQKEALLLLVPLGTMACESIRMDRERELDQAVRMLTEAVVYLPTLARLYYERGHMYVLNHKGNLAQEDFQRAIKYSPSHGPGDVRADSWTGLGKLHHDKGDFEASIKAYRKALEMDPKRTVVHRLMTDSLLAQGYSREAAREMEVYLDQTLETGLPPIKKARNKLATEFLALGLIYDRIGEHRSAMSAYTRGLKLDRDPRLLLRRGLMFLREKSPRLAEGDFGELLAIQSDNQEGRLGQAEARIQQGNIEGAVEAMNAARTFGIDGAIHLYSAARIHTMIAFRLGSKRPTPTRRIREHEQETVDYLTKALESLPRNERQEFWKRYVERDPILSGVRRNQDNRRKWAALLGSSL